LVGEVGVARRYHAGIRAVDVNRRRQQSLDREARPPSAFGLGEHLMRRFHAVLGRLDGGMAALTERDQLGQRVAMLAGARLALRPCDDRRQDCEKENGPRDQPRTAVRIPDAARLAANVSSRVTSSTMKRRWVSDAM